MKTRTLLLSAGLLCALTLPAFPADWPQWRGPDRNDVSKETGLLKSWPKAGPKLLWSYEEAGIGYSGPAIVGNHLYTMGARDETEFVYALDVKTGKEVWSTETGPLLQNGYGSGPRGTPTLDGDKLYALSGQGNLVCVEITGGKKEWTKSLRQDFGGRIPNWGYAESPLIDGDRVVCSPGGDQGTIVALDKKTGEKIWQSSDLTDPAGYSSIVPDDIGGVRQYVQVTMKGVAGVAAKDGKLLWHFLQPTYRTAVIPTPIVQGNYVYATAGYGAGCNLLKLSPDGAEGTKEEEVYASNNMDNKHGGVVLIDGHIYGWTDHGSAWICQDFKTGEVVWQSKKLGRGSITYADGRLYCYSEKDGTCVLIEASPKAWTEHGRFKIPKQTEVRSPRGGVWTHPVVANGQLYLRDQNLIFCFDVAASSTSSARR
ncbi:MAG TPA: PQQ-binding-like beta-propeller repeat protein [Gemmataceae bacterium]|jgi:outer membrane protein assembly factor BamB|nr:PQQ-binding-like beta-propeller repeat protein [Gemmataceae bacterium]